MGSFLTTIAQHTPPTPTRLNIVELSRVGGARCVLDRSLNAVQATQQQKLTELEAVHYVHFSAQMAEMSSLVLVGRS